MIYAFLYCVSSYYFDKYGFKKLGCTIHPVHRLCTYNTGDPLGIGLEKKYNGIWKVSAKTKKELLRLESKLHNHFRSVRQRRTETGKNTEWFSVTIDEVDSFLRNQPFVICRLTEQEISNIHIQSERKKRTKQEEEEFQEEIEFSKIQRDFFENEENTKQQFFDTFLPIGSTPRRIQLELWDIWESICNENDSYKGIVQWPTGTGKTIAMMMLFVSSFLKTKKNGRIFRGCLISPKNDILDTIIEHIRKLSKWGIEVIEGHNAQLSTTVIPTDKDYIVTVTHASLTDKSVWDRLVQGLTHCHYDEVHRITGEELFQNIQSSNIPFLTGTSATPETSSEIQNKKLAELFGTPLPILHTCSIEEAVAEGWIAQPRFCVHVLPNTINRLSIIASFMGIINQSILDKKEKGLWKGGKIIVYLPLIKEVDMALAIANKTIPDAVIYSAIETKEYKSDDSFLKDNADGTIRILFACERYREGSDIYGLEITQILMGNTIGTHILLQVAGRALRMDYAGKEGWCVIVRPSDEGVTEDDVFDMVLLQVMNFIGAKSFSSTDKIRRAVETFFGTVEMGGRIYDLDETVRRIQQMYIRKDFERGSHKEKYDVVRGLNQELEIRTRDDYFTSSGEHAKFIDDPKSYFNEIWVSWYHFLGVNIDIFPKSKPEWILACKERGIFTWVQYKEKKYADLPENPSELYEDYTNWDKEFGVEEEFVW